MSAADEFRAIFFCVANYARLENKHLGEVRRTNEGRSYTATGKSDNSAISSYVPSKATPRSQRRIIRSEM